MEVPTDPTPSAGFFASKRQNNATDRQWHNEFPRQVAQNLAISSSDERLGKQFGREFAGMDLVGGKKEDGSGIDGQNVVILDEIGSLCSECRAEEMAEKMEAKNLGRKLAELVDGMNRAEIVRHKRETQEEQKMELKKAMEEAQKRTEQKHFWRENERKSAREKMAEREVWEGWEPSKMRREKSAISSEDTIWADEQQGKVKRLREQLRRNEALKRSVERLDQFKQREWEEQERASEIATANRQMEKELLAQQRMLMRRENSLDSRLDDPNRFKGGISAQSAHPAVFEAWKKAREADEARYRILQEGEEYGRRSRSTQISQRVIERKRCRKCMKPISVQQFVRQAIQ